MSFHDAKIIGADYPNAEYIKENCPRGEPGHVMSRSSLLEFARNPARWKAGYGRNETDSTAFGSLVDCLLLSPGEFGSRYWTAPATYESEGMKCPRCGSVTDSAKCRDCKCERVKAITLKPWSAKSETCQEMRAIAEKNGAVVITKDELAEAGAAVKSLLSVGAINGIIQESDRQVRMDAVWHDGATGLKIPVKTLPDLVPRAGGVYGASMADLKTSVCGHPGYWKKIVGNYGYDVQAAFELDIFNLARPDDARKEFRHIVVESFPPFATAHYLLSEEFLSIGRQVYRAALARYAECLATGIWPGYSDLPSRMIIEGWPVIEPTTWRVDEGNQAWTSAPTEKDTI